MEKPANRDIAARFDAVAERYDACTNPYCVSRRGRFVSRHAGGRILEIGAATGAVSALAGSGSMVLADRSFRMCVAAASKKISTALCCDAEELPFADESFDSVVGAEMIYYLDRPEVFAAEAFRILKPNGRLVLTFANDAMRIADKVRAVCRRLGMSRTYFDDGIRRFLPLARVVEMLDGAGFRVSSPERLVILPFAACDGINGILEKSALGRWALFTGLVAEKKSASEKHS